MTLSAALANLPIFPETLTGTGKLTVTAGSGAVIVAGDQSFVHRGVFRHSTSDWELEDRTLATQASRTYHLRWTPGQSGGWALKDLSDGGYNPGSLNEWNPTFDTTLDDILFARIETNSSNVASITTLLNKDRWNDVLLTERGRDAPY